VALSPNYGWAEPDNSSLVKNGAQDIRALGDAIDTSVWNVGYGQAGKNKIINGDFYVNQRNFTSTTTNFDYTFDRFRARISTGTSTFTAQTFATGASPSPYEFKNYLQIDVTGQSGASAFSLVEHTIEDVRTLAGQTATISFFAKASSGTPSIAAQLDQNPVDSADVIITGTKIQISTSWVRYSATVSIPAITGAINNTSSRLTLRLWLSAGSTFDTRTQTLGIQTGTFQIAGVQLEAGSKATPFQTATGTIQGELAACKYYYREIGGVANGYPIVGGSLVGTGNQIRFPISFDTGMRVAPTITKLGTWNVSSNTSQPSAVFIGQNGFSIQIESTSGAVAAAYAYPDSTDDKFTCSSEL
jgi:hypothetical protein